MEAFLGILILIGCGVLVYLMENIIHSKHPKDITPKEDRAIKNIIDTFIREQKRPLSEKEIEHIISAVKYWRKHNGHSPLMKNVTTQFFSRGNTFISNNDLILDTIIHKQWKIEYPKDYKKEQNGIHHLKSK
ncbi:MAG: hypothetical protein SO314_06455 [Alphaproteobacteria bacterium]|nr:hypothetical protein [Alphaproteobacteria bacterium]